MSFFVSDEVINSSSRRSKEIFSQPRVHGMVYEPGTGEAKMLDVNIAESLKDLGGIYDLFKTD